MSDLEIQKIARQLTPHEQAALVSLPAQDRGHLPDERWWAYRSIIDYGLAVSNGDFTLVASELGKAVLLALEQGRS